MVFVDLSGVLGYDPATGGYRSSDPRYRSLVAAEVIDLVRMAQTTTPSFEPPNAKWEDHHPIARAVWEARGVKRVMHDAKA
jgi:hypothetical protein